MCFLAGSIFMNGRLAPVRGPLERNVNGNKLRLDPQTVATANNLEEHGKRRLFSSDKTAASGAFRFARLPTEFEFEISFAKQAGNDQSYLYTEEDIALILRAMHTMLGFMNIGLWSGNPGTAHFIGTASCLVKLKRPAIEVALGVMHSLYLQRWREDFNISMSDECARRNSLAEVLGSELETQLWQLSGLHATGPYTDCLKIMHKLLKLSHEEGDDTKKLRNLLEQVDYWGHSLPHHLLCDEIEEFIGGDIALGGNWKRRNREHFEVLISLSDWIEEPLLSQWIREAAGLSSYLHHPNPTPAYKELSPPNRTVLLNRTTLEFHPQAHKEELDRLQYLMSVTQTEQLMTPPYLGPKCVSITCRTIEDMRGECRLASGSLHSNSTTALLGYLEAYRLGKERLERCEHEGLYRPVPMPKVPPQWAQMNFF